MKRKKRQKPRDPSIEEELKQIFAAQEAFEYRDLIDEQDLAHAKSQYLELLMRIERSVFSEEERKEIEGQMAETWKKIETLETRLTAERERIALLRKRLERVRDVYEKQRNIKIHERHD